jgi:hypothetical protein
MWSLKALDIRGKNEAVHNQILPSWLVKENGGDNQERVKPARQQRANRRGNRNNKQ